MKALKFVGSIVILVAFVAVAGTITYPNSTADAQVITNHELSHFAGGAESCCKGPLVDAECMKCQPTGKNTSIECTSGSTKQKRNCIKGTPDDCDMSGSITCSSTYRSYTENEDCQTPYTFIKEDCKVKTASGTLCD